MRYKVWRGFTDPHGVFRIDETAEFTAHNEAVRYRNLRQAETTVNSFWALEMQRTGKYKIIDRPEVRQKTLRELREYLPVFGR